VTALGLLTGCSSDGKSTASTAAPPSAVTATDAATTVPATTVATTTVPPTTAPATTAVDTTIAGPKSLPRVQVPADVYRIDTFSIPFDITTQGDWVRYGTRKELFYLGRGSNGTTELIVSTGLVPGSTPQEVIDNVCAGSIKFAEPSTTTLFGQAAIQQEGRVTSFCIWAALDTVTQLGILEGHTVRLVAADVNGTIVLIVADAVSADWPATADDIDPMVASMTLVG
jgi:hypothetical protein